MERDTKIDELNNVIKTVDSSTLTTLSETNSSALEIFLSRITTVTDSTSDDNWADAVKTGITSAITKIKSSIEKVITSCTYIANAKTLIDNLKKLCNDYVTEYNDYENMGPAPKEYNEYTDEKGEKHKERNKDYDDYMNRKNAFEAALPQLAAEVHRVEIAVNNYFKAVDLTKNEIDGNVFATGSESIQFNYDEFFDGQIKDLSDISQEIEDPAGTQTPTPTVTEEVDPPTSTPTETEEVDPPTPTPNATEEANPPTSTPTATEEADSPTPTVTEEQEVFGPPTPTFLKAQGPWATNLPDPVSLGINTGLPDITSIKPRPLELFGLSRKPLPWENGGTAIEGLDVTNLPTPTSTATTDSTGTPTSTPTATEEIDSPTPSVTGEQEVFGPPTPTILKAQGPLANGAPGPWATNLPDPASLGINTGLPDITSIKPSPSDLFGPNRTRLPWEAIANINEAPGASSLPTPIPTVTDNSSLPTQIPTVTGEVDPPTSTPTTTTGSIGNTSFAGNGASSPFLRTMIY